MRSRVATFDDLEGVIETLTLAFESDPLWGWAFPEQEDLRSWWRFLAGSALRYPSTHLAGDFEAVAVWIPPGGIELTEAEEAGLEPLVADLAGRRGPEVLELVESFGLNHPAEPPHFYLSLLGTHPDHRGKGLGMALLADCLARIDPVGVPAYLESSNAANDHRYETLGFNRIGSFNRPDGQTTVSTMWRDPRPTPA